MTTSTTKFSMTGFTMSTARIRSGLAALWRQPLLALSLKLDAVAGVVLFVALQLLGLRAAQLSR